MYEVEVKVRADHERVRDRLQDAEAAEIGSVEQEDTYYNAPHRDFAATDEALRIRRETAAEHTTANLTYKGPLVDRDSKTRKEIETTVGSTTAMDRILDALGFAPVATVHKHRERFGIEDFTITLDSVEELGEFLEIEAEAPEEEIDTTRQEAFEVLRKLDLDPEDQIRTSYLELVLETRDR